MKDYKLNQLEFIYKNRYLSTSRLGILMHLTTRYLETESLTSEWLDIFKGMYGSFYSDFNLDLFHSDIDYVLSNYFVKNEDNSYSNFDLDQIIKISKQG